MNENILTIANQDMTMTSYVCRASFKTFIQLFHFYLYKKPFIFKPLHLQIIKELEDRVFGLTDKNLLINVAPRSGKSQILQYFVAWGYIINPQSNFILTSYGSSLVLKFSDLIKSIITSDLYQNMFNLKMDKSNSAKEFWKIENGGEFRASAMGSIITGFGAGIMSRGWGGALIIDDPLKASDAKSSVARQNCIDFYVDTLKTRKNKPSTPIILIMQRLHVDDLTGYILKNEKNNWKYLSIETLDEETEESVWEEQFPAKMLLNYKKLLPAFYYSQYQQKPIIVGGQVIKSEWFSYYNPELRTKYKKIVMTADTAMKTSEHNDYSVFMVGGVTVEGKLHILGLLRGKWEAPDLKRQAVAFYNRFRPDVVYIEDKASGTGLIQELKRDTGMPIKPLKANKDKLTRLESVLAHIEAGNVLLPKDLTYSFNPELLSECESFSRDNSHKHDDIVDTLVYLIMTTIQKLRLSIYDVL